MPPEVLKLLRDMQEAAADIAAFAAGKSFEAFQKVPILLAELDNLLP
jgi:hypothetical protein